jgi:hypothetical protein
MRKFQIAIALVVAMCAPVCAQDITASATSDMSAKPARVSAFKIAMSEVVILRYRAALKLKAEQEKYWPAVAAALRTLAREPNLNEEAVRKIVPAVTPLLTSLDDNQKQVAMGFAQKAGLTQYASMF